MEANRTTRAADLEGGAPTAAQPTTFDARDSLAGRLTDMTVSRAAAEPTFHRRKPTLDMLNTTEEGDQ